MKNQIFTVFQFEFFGFIKQIKNWGTVITFAVLSLIFAFLPSVMSFFDNLNSSSSNLQTAIIFDNSPFTNETIDEFVQSLGDDYFTLNTFDEGIDAYENGEIESFYHITKDELKFYTKTNNISTFETASKVTDSLYDFAVQDFVEKHNAPLDEFEKISDYTNTLTSIELDEYLKDPTKESNDLISVARFSLSYVFLFVMYVALLQYGSFMSVAVAQEKTGKTMESLLSVVNVNALIIGKFLAIFIASIIQIAVIIGTLFLTLSFSSTQSSKALSTGAPEVIPYDLYKSLSEVFSAEFIFYFTTLFFLGFAMYLLIYVGFSSFVSKMEDLASHVSFATYSIVIAFLTAMFLLTNPDNVFFKALSYFPLFTPVAMFARYGSSTATTFDMIYAIVISLLSTIGLAFFSAKLYRIGVLVYGTKTSAIQIVKSLFSKNK